MRRQPTKAESLLWSRLKGRRLGVRFRRQHPIAGYIVDFYCAECRLAIELDGGGHAHDEQRRYDERRDRVLSRLGIDVVRVWNTDVLRCTDDVLAAIWARVHAAVG